LDLLQTFLIEALRDIATSAQKNDIHKVLYLYEGSKRYGFVATVLFPASMQNPQPLMPTK
jgi:hypothetical protein